MEATSIKPPQRIYSIDILRGLAIALMTVDHAREFFFKSIALSDPMCVGCLPPEVFFTRWITHFCAPVFIFLAGISAYLYGQKPGRTQSDLSCFLLQRAAVLILLEVTLINLTWTYALPPTTIYLQVIWAIGIGMACLAGLLWLPRWIMAVITVLLIAGHPLLNPIHFNENTIQHLFWSMLHERNRIPMTDYIAIRTSYPLIPWIGIMSAGYLAGGLFGPNRAPEKRKQILLWSGLSLILAFGLLRVGNIYGEASPFTPFPEQWLRTLMSFLNLTKYPPSFLYALMTLGFSLLSLYWFEGPLNAVRRLLLQFGRVSMFYYILHLYLLHTAAWVTATILDTPAGQKFSVPHIGWVWGIAALTLVVSYPLVQKFAQLKAQHPKSWLRFI